MRPFTFCATLALLFSTAGFAQDPMPMGGGNMGKPMAGRPMPHKVEDKRQVISLTEAERAVVAAEMRQMLASVQGVTDALARGDTQAVVDAASRSGMAMMQEVPAPIRMKFPAPFTQLGMTSHRVFDRIAQETKTVTDPGPTLKLLSEAMQSCIACHASYRFAPPR
ncbi:MAG: hypothetical protein HY274_07390 [Gammaproteobacteria bacterium]|nr:hypothetical protein [Gammaproteobacteria bacterium]